MYIVVRMSDCVTGCQMVICSSHVFISPLEILLLKSHQKIQRLTESLQPKGSEKAPMKYHLKCHLYT